MNLTITLFLINIKIEHTATISSRFASAGILYKDYISIIMTITSNIQQNTS